MPSAGRCGSSLQPNARFMPIAVMRAYRPRRRRRRLCPGIHAFLVSKQDVDARHKAGHDVERMSDQLHRVEPAEVDREALAGQQRRGLVQRQADDVGVGADDLDDEAAGKPCAA